MAFAWYWRKTLLEWESNPMAEWVYGATGLPGVFACRIALMCFGYAVSRSEDRSAKWITVIAGLAHLYVLAVLVQSWPILSAELAARNG